MLDTEIPKEHEISRRADSGSYGIYLSTDYETIILEEFVDYQLAWRFLKQQGELLDLPTKDLIQIRRKKIKQKYRRK